GRSDERRRHRLRRAEPADGLRVRRSAEPIGGRVRHGGEAEGGGAVRVFRGRGRERTDERVVLAVAEPVVVAAEGVEDEEALTLRAGRLTPEVGSWHGRHAVRVVVDNGPVAAGRTADRTRA